MASYHHRHRHPRNGMFEQNFSHYRPNGPPGQFLQFRPHLSGCPDWPAPYNYPPRHVFDQRGHCHRQPGFNSGKFNPRHRFHSTPNTAHKVGHNVNGHKSLKKSVKKEEDFKFNCEICDRGFKTEEKYKEHCSGHETCKVDGCSYTAAPKLVKLHFDLHHKPGFAKKIWNLESKEDIAKWRAERKKNFPTKENVERKKQELAARIERGEVIETKQFGKMRGRGRGRGRGRCRGRGNMGCGGRRFSQSDDEPVSAENPNMRGNATEHNRNRRQRKRTFPLTNDNSHTKTETASANKEERPVEKRPNVLTGHSKNEDEPSDIKKLKLDAQKVLQDQSLNPLDFVLADRNLSDSSTDSEPEDITSNKTLQPSATNTETSKSNGSVAIGALGALMSMYGSSSDSENEDEEVIEPQTVSTQNCSETATAQNQLASAEEPRGSCTVVRENDYASQSKTIKTTSKPAQDSNEIGTKRANVKTQPVSTDKCSESVSQNRPTVKENAQNYCAVDNEKVYPSQSDGTTSKTVQESKKIVTKRDSENSRERDKEKSNMCAESQTIGMEQFTKFRPRQNQRRNQYTAGTSKPCRPPTLLQKLLAKEIRHERNVVMQCIRYIVKNDFFGLEKPDLDCNGDENDNNIDKIKTESPKDLEMKKEVIETDIPKDVKMEKDVIKTVALKDVEMENEAETPKNIEVKHETTKTDMQKNIAMKNEVVEADIPKNIEMKTEVIKTDTPTDIEMKQEVIKTVTPTDIEMENEAETPKNIEVKHESTKTDAPTDIALKNEVVETDIPNDIEMKNTVIKTGTPIDVEMKHEVIETVIPNDTEMKNELIKTDASNDLEMKSKVIKTDVPKDIAMKNEVVEAHTPKDIEMKNEVIKTDTPMDIAVKNEVVETDTPKDIEMKKEVMYI